MDQLRRWSLLIKSSTCTLYVIFIILVSLENDKSIFQDGDMIMLKTKIVWKFIYTQAPTIQKNVKQCSLWQKVHLASENENKTGENQT